MEADPASAPGPVGITSLVVVRCACPGWKHPIWTMRHGCQEVSQREAKTKQYKDKHNAELQRTDPGTKVTGEFSTRGHIFPPNV